jgi:hypothetical protein
MLSLGNLLFPRVGFIVTSLETDSRALTMTRLSCHRLLLKFVGETSSIANGRMRG